jgi:hypothetical protein
MTQCHDSDPKIGYKLMKTRWINPLLLLFLAAAMTSTAALGQTNLLLSLDKNGRLAWSNALTNQMLTILHTTNLQSGPWIADKAVLTAGSAGNIQLDLSSIVGFYRAAASRAGLDPRLVLHLSFDNWAGYGNVLDLTANHCDALVFGPTNIWPTLASRPNGGNASHIGTPQYFGVTDVASFKYLTNGTVAVWVAYDNGFQAGEGYYSYILDAGYTWPEAYGWTLGHDPYQSTYWYTYDYDGTRLQSLLFPDWKLTGWHHYGVTWDGTNFVGYFDGSAFATNSQTIPYLQVDSAGWLAIGTMQHDGTPQSGDDPYPNAGWLNGTVDEVRIYKTALPAEDLRRLANNQEPVLAP